MRYTQPQGECRLVEPFTWGVNFSGSGAAREIRKGTSGSVFGGPTATATNIGSGLRLVSGSSQYWSGSPDGVPSQWPITFVTAFRLDNLDVAARIFQSGMTYNYAGFFFWIFSNGSAVIGCANNIDISGAYLISLPSGTFQAGKSYFVSARLEASGLSVFVNGTKISGTVSGSTTGIVTVGSPTVGRLDYAGGSYYTSATVLTVAAAQTAAPDAYLKSLSDNPWQIYADDKKPIFIGVGTVGGGTTDILTAQSISTSAPTVSTSPLGQIQALASKSISASVPTISTPALTAASNVDNLIAQALSTGQITITQAVLAQHHVLSAQNISVVNPEISKPALTAASNLDSLSAQNIIAGQPTVSITGISQINVLIAQPISAGSPIITKAALNRTEAYPTVEEIVAALLAHPQFLTLTKFLALKDI